MYAFILILSSVCGFAVSLHCLGETCHAKRHPHTESTSVHQVCVLERIRHDHLHGECHTNRSSLYTEYPLCEKIHYMVPSHGHCICTDETCISNILQKSGVFECGSHVCEGHYYCHMEYHHHHGIYYSCTPDHPSNYRICTDQNSVKQYHGCYCRSSECVGIAEGKITNATVTQPPTTVLPTHEPFVCGDHACSSPYYCHVHPHVPITAHCTLVKHTICTVEILQQHHSCNCATTECYHMAENIILGITTSTTLKPTTATTRTTTTQSTPSTTTPTTTSPTTTTTATSTAAATTGISTTTEMSTSFPSNENQGIACVRMKCDDYKPLCFVYEANLRIEGHCINSMYLTSFRPCTRAYGVTSSSGCFCEDTECVIQAIHFHYEQTMTKLPLMLSTTSTTPMTTTTSTTPTTTTTSTSATLTTTTATTAGCTDMEDSVFTCASFETRYDLCKAISGALFNIAILRCPKFCGICAETTTAHTKETTSPSTTRKPTTSTSTTQIQTTTKSPMTSAMQYRATTELRTKSTTASAIRTTKTALNSLLPETTTFTVALKTESTPNSTGHGNCQDKQPINCADLQRDIHICDLPNADVFCPKSCGLCHHVQLLTPDPMEFFGVKRATVCEDLQRINCTDLQRDIRICDLPNADHYCPEACGHCHH